MNKVILYQSPGACSLVTLTALEQVGLDYKDRLVDLQKGEQFSSDYLAINPKKNGPAIGFDGRIMTENAAIVAFLHRQYPAAKLLPSNPNAVLNNRGLIDLVWCSSTIYPMVRQIRAPAKFTKGDAAGVVADGMEKFTLLCQELSARFSDQRWWYGEQWSIIDAYLYWTYQVAQRGGFSLADFPNISDHENRLRAVPSVQRALARERAASVPARA